MNKITCKVKKHTIGMYELMANLFIVLIAALGGVRAIEWIVSTQDKLARVSVLYVNMAKIAPVHVFGFSLLTASLLLLMAVFLKHRMAYLSLLIGGTLGAFTHFLYAMASVGAANLFSTYYTALILAVGQVILAVIGVVGIWKKK